jgi:hypothetical protein
MRAHGALPNRNKGVTHVWSVSDAAGRPELDAAEAAGRDELPQRRSSRGAPDRGRGASPGLRSPMGRKRVTCCRGERGGTLPQPPCPAASPTNRRNAGSTAPMPAAAYASLALSGLFEWAWLLVLAVAGPALLRPNVAGPGAAASPGRAAAEYWGVLAAAALAR